MGEPPLRLVEGFEARRITRRRRGRNSVAGACDTRKAQRWTDLTEHVLSVLSVVSVSSVY
jgi:hypothetical protein